MKHYFINLFKVIFTKAEKEHSEKYLRRVAFFNKYSLLFHALASCLIVFVVELISRRDFLSACTFVAGHTGAFIYNAFIVFASLCLVYLFRRRAFVRVIISGFWIILGVINGCILSNRVTPFGFTDLKCINDLFAMNNTNYFTAQEAMLVVTGLGLFALGCIVLFIKGPKFQGRIHKLIVSAAIISVLFIGLPVTTSAAQSANVVASYFSNIAQGYENYGFIYGFSSSVMDRGMRKPEGYSEETVAAIEADVEQTKEETAVTAQNAPNIICVLLESFCDPDEIRFLEYDKDPVPTFHYLEENYSTGYLTVPVVGAGTANTEFEILTGMGMQFFGTGEYPYKTILKKTDCESVASDLSAIGYGTHAVHNNGGNFYSRVNAFSMMGFDTFTSKELMNIQTYTPNGSWATDDILVDETIKTLDATPGQPDFTYTITVGTHGDYPTTPVIADPKYPISGVEDEGAKNQWTYYVNQLNEIDTFMADLIKKVNARGEDTLIVFFGDHLPTMGLTDEDMLSGDIYKTNYVTWNNFGLKKADADLCAYQLMAEITAQAGIHEGTILTYHQTQKGSADYCAGLENLQYDILYGSRYCYGGVDKYPATDIVMGIDETVIDSAVNSISGTQVMIYGDNFTRWSKVFVNDVKVNTLFSSSGCLVISREDISDGDTIVINQMGSGNSIFRSSNTYVYTDPDAGTDGGTETSEPAPDTDIQTETQS